jgi:hypothetical protein
MMPQIRPSFPIDELLGLLIIFFIKIISPNQGRSSSELQLISYVGFFHFHKKSCGTDENYRSLESVVETNPACSQSITTRHVNLASVITNREAGRVCL